MAGKARAQTDKVSSYPRGEKKKNWDCSTTYRGKTEMKRAGRFNIF